MKHVFGNTINIIMAYGLLISIPLHHCRYHGISSSLSDPGLAGSCNLTERSKYICLQTAVDTLLL